MNRFIAVLAALLAPAAGANTFLLTGALDDGSAPAGGLFTFAFAILGADDAVLWQEQQDNVVVADGVFAIDVGAATALPVGVPAPARLRVTIDGDELPSFLLTSLVQADIVAVADQANASPTATRIGTVTAADAVRIGALAVTGGPTAPFTAVTGLPAGLLDGDQGTDVSAAAANLTLGGRRLSVVNPVAGDRFGTDAIDAARFATGAISDVKVGAGVLTGAKVGADLTRADLTANVGEAQVAGRALFMASAEGCDGTPLLTTSSSCRPRSCVGGRVGCDGTGCSFINAFCLNTRLGILVAP